MKILMVTRGVPHPANGGAGLREFSLLDQLRARHEIRVLCLIDVEEDLVQLPAARAALAGVSFDTVRLRALAGVRGLVGPRAVRRLPFAARSYFDPELARRIRRQVEAWDPDVVQVEHSFLGGYRAALPDGARARTILTLHNLGWLQYRRLAELPLGTLFRLSARAKARLMDSWEPALSAGFDHCIAVSEHEAKALREAAPGIDVSVVENGVDTTSLVPGPRPEGPPRLLFVGTMSYPPNADAVLWFTREILPRIRREHPDVTLDVVGRSPPPALQRLAADPAVRVTGAVDDVVPYYRDASACIVPLRAGGGTRLKILEAMALGVPVVSTTVGCEGLDVIDGEQVLVADEAEAFAERVSTVASDPSAGAALAEAARQRVVDRYGWERLASQLDAVYQRLVPDASERSPLKT